MNTYLEADQESGKRFYQEFNSKGKLVMLNLLKFKAVADYTKLDSIKPKQELTGLEAYRLYMEKTLPELEKSGSRIIYFGESKNFLIGPEQEVWDAMLLVEHQSAVAFIAFAQNAEYLKHTGHRAAALEDSRLLPSSEIKGYIHP